MPPTMGTSTVTLFAAYQLSSGQAPSGMFVPIPKAATTTAIPLPPGVIPIPGSNPTTTAAPAQPVQTTAAPQTTAVQTPQTTAAAIPAVTTAPVTTAPVTNAPATPAPVPLTTTALPPGVIPVIPAIPAIPAPVPVPAGPFPPVNGRPSLPSPPPVALEPIPLAPTTPVAPAGYVFGAFDQLCPVPDINRDYVCRSTNDMGSDLLPGQSPGFLKCERSYDCCTCSSLLCQVILSVFLSLNMI